MSELPPAGSIRERIAATVRQRIASGGWKVGDRLPSESELAAHFGVARMTVHAALASLAQQGLLDRRPGAGTRVAAPKPESTHLEVRNIREEIAGRGGRHSTRVVRLEREWATAAVAREFELEPGNPVFHSVLVHLENGTPVQVEDRYVNPAFAPDYLAQDYTQATPYDHLMGLASLDEVEHTIEALLPDASIRRLLTIDAGEPVLTIRRRTFSRGMVATVARLLYAPGSRLVGRFAPNAIAAARREAPPDPAASIPRAGNRLRPREQT